MKNIAIIGTGIAGLTIAYHLQKDANVVMFEKARGVGGRLATRYAQEWEFDHGTPFFTVNTEQFQVFLQPLIQNGIIQEWNATVLQSKQKPYKKSYWVGVPRMNSIGKTLAKNLDINLQTKIISITRDGEKWKLVDDNSKIYENFDYVITTTPPQQAFDILPLECSYKKALQNIEMMPTFSIMVGLESLPTNFENWDILHPASDIIQRIVVNNNKPLRKIKPSFVIHTYEKWAHYNIKNTKEVIIAAILAELQKILHCDISAEVIQVHRWLYANVKNDSKNHFLIDKIHGLISCGDWCVGAGIEGAFQSGYAVNQCLQTLYKKT